VPPLVVARVSPLWVLSNTWMPKMSPFLTNPPTNSQTKRCKLTHHTIITLIPSSTHLHHETTATTTDLPRPKSSSTLATTSLHYHATKMSPLTPSTRPLLRLWTFSPPWICLWNSRTASQS